MSRPREGRVIGMNMQQELAFTGKYRPNCDIGPCPGNKDAFSRIPLQTVVFETPVVHRIPDTDRTDRQLDGKNLSTNWQVTVS